VEDSFPTLLCIYSSVYASGINKPLREKSDETDFLGGVQEGADQLLMAKNFLRERAEPQSGGGAAGTYSIYVN